LALEIGGGADVEQQPAEQAPVATGGLVVCAFGAPEGQETRRREEYIWTERKEAE